VVVVAIGDEARRACGRRAGDHRRWHADLAFNATTRHR
jgi:hypothetical protein